MTDLKRLLADSDPIGAEPALHQADVEAMRRRVLSTRTPQLAHGWTWTLTLATALTVLVIAGVGLTRRGAVIPGKASTPSAVVAQQRDETDGRRQLQFATPGGTRVIWVFNADFETR